jgi:hypothetical protein
LAKTLAGKDRNAPQMLSALRNLVILLLHRSKAKNIAAALCHHALNPEECFGALGFKEFT